MTVNLATIAKTMDQKVQTYRSQLPSIITAMGCGAFLKTLLSLGWAPEIISSTSLRMAIKASQKLRPVSLKPNSNSVAAYRSSSCFGSDSVGSINQHLWQVSLTR